MLLESAQHLQYHHLLHNQFLLSIPDDHSRQFRRDLRSRLVKNVATAAELHGKFKFSERLFTPVETKFTAELVVMHPDTFDNIRNLLQLYEDICGPILVTADIPDESV